MIQQISKVVGVQIIRYCSHVSDATLADRFVAVSIIGSMYRLPGVTYVDADYDHIEHQMDYIYIFIHIRPRGSHDTTDIKGSRRTDHPLLFSRQ